MSKFHSERLSVQTPITCPYAYYSHIYAPIQMAAIPMDFLDQSGKNKTILIKIRW